MKDMKQTLKCRLFCRSLEISFPWQFEQITTETSFLTLKQGVLNDLQGGECLRERLRP